MPHSKKSTLLALFFFAFLAGCGSSGNDDVSLRIMSENFYPYNYQENGVWNGLTYEVVQEILARNGRTETVELLDWNAAIAALEEEDNAVLFTTTLTPERKDKFKWVGPVGRITWALYAVNGRTDTLASLNDARSERIAVVEHYPTHERLLAAGLPNLVVFSTVAEAVSAVFEGRVDLVALDAGSVYRYAASLGQASRVQKVYDLEMQLLYIAFSRGVSDSIVRRWQETLDEMKDEGLFAQIHQSYIPVSRPPEKLQLYTEEYPPVSFSDENDYITGGAAEMVREIAARLNVPDNMTVTTWENAYNLALYNPRVVLFSTARIAGREDLFHWVGPIRKDSAHFYTKQGSGIVVDSLDAARGLRAVGTCASWHTEQLLQNMGFTNLVSVADPETLVRMLMSGEIDATVFTDVTANSIIINRKLPKLVRMLS